MQQKVGRHLQNKYLQTLKCCYNMQSAGVVLKHNKQLTHSSNKTSDFLTLPPPLLPLARARYCLLSL